MQVPNVGDLFEYNGHKYRVTAWLKYAPAPKVPDFLNLNLPAHPDRLTFCHQDEATHISGSGISGIILHVDKVTVSGKVSWSKEVLQDAIDQANRLAGHSVY